MTESDAELRQDLAEAIEKINIEHAELTGQSARAAAILAVTFLDNELEGLVHSKFPRNLSNTIWKEIAGPGFTPLGSYKARNDVAYAFGFYGPHTHAALEFIGSIRNKFAHESDARSFEFHSVTAQYEKLMGNLAARQIKPGVCIPKCTPSEMREYFLALVEAFTERIASVRLCNLILEVPPSDPLP